ncbi:photo-regulated tyrosinase [Mycena leptocephala]|nr:photo-regulated tyrosinase [Mycena leptocephala]
MAHFIVTGALQPTGSVVPPERREINAFIRGDPDHQYEFDLFVQALCKLMLQSIHSLINFILADIQESNINDPDSYYQMCGIHGLPFMEWSGSTSPSGPGLPKGNEFGGYCTHATVLFPTWHRPYVALIEQVIQAHALKIAKTYTDANLRGLMVAAANRLRLPYWDWGVNAVPPPEIIELPTLEVLKAPNGRLVLVPNPFRAYTFPPEFLAQPVELFETQPALAVWRKTLRCPTGVTADADTNLPRLKAVLQVNQSDLTGRLFNMLTRTKTWKEFSNRSVGTGGGQANSLESVHDSPHSWIGGDPTTGPSGHMRYPRAAAFDPIFWLHHAYVDRLLALWSAMNPDVWVTPGPAIEGTFTIPWDASLTVDTDLTPFWRDQEHYWSSADVKTTAVFNYRYTDFDNLDMTDRNAVYNSIYTTVSRLYNKQVSRLSATPHAVITSKDNRWFVSHAVATTANPDTVNKEQSRDWTACIQVEKYALNGSFSTYIFLGPVPSDSSEWFSSPSFVGSDSVFSDHQAPGGQSDGVGYCANCQQQAAARVVVEGFVHLNTALARRIADPDENITSFEPVDVVPYLKEHLSWRVLSGHNAPIAAAGFPPSLDVQVSATPMWIRHGDKIRSYGQPEFFPEVTEGRNA